MSRVAERMGAALFLLLAVYIPHAHGARHVPGVAVLYVTDVRVHAE